MAKNDSYLLADIGGTNARFAILNEARDITDELVLTCADYAHINDAIAAYYAQTEITQKPKSAVFAVAGDPRQDPVRLVNSPWVFTRAEVKERFDLDDVSIMNDFTAIALSVPYIREHKLYKKIGGGAPVEGMPYNVIGAGTGLGVSTVVPASPKHIILTNDAGGHDLMAAINDRQSDVLGVLRKTKYTHISSERVISGRGLQNIYDALCVLEEKEAVFTDPADVSRNGISGECTIAREAVDMFCSFAGIKASNLCIQTEALGGVWISGGVVEKVGDYFDSSCFRTFFETKGRYTEYMAAIPTYRILHSLPAMLGLREFVQNNGNYRL